MAFLLARRKEDLMTLAADLDLTFEASFTKLKLKELIVKSPDYVEDDVKKMLDGIVEERTKGEEKAEKERIRKEEKEERMQKEEREYELEKLRIQAQRIANIPNSAENVQTPNKPIHETFHKFNMQEDISLNLTLFERHAELTFLPKKDWVQKLIGLIPIEIAHLIAREPADKCNDYDHVKDLLLQRFKFSPEKFRLLFLFHQKDDEKTWQDFQHELQTYFDGWTLGLKVNTYDQLRELIIADQMKEKAPYDLREHFLDEWSTINSPIELAKKFEDYEDVRRTIKPKQFKSFTKGSSNNHKYFRGQEHFHLGNNGNEKKYFQSKRTVYDKRIKQLTCSYCKGSGHYAVDCTKRRKDSKNNKSSSSPVQICSRISKERIKTRKITIGNKTFEALIDTGSSVTLIREDVSKGIIEQSKLSRDIVVLSGLGKYEVKTKGSFQREIELDGEKYSVTWHVVPTPYLEFQAVIGSDILEQAFVGFDKKGVYFRKHEDKVWFMHTQVYEARIEDEIEVKHVTNPRIRKELSELINNYIPKKTETTNVSMRIILKDDVPVYQPARRLSFPEKQAVNKQIDEWLDQGIVRQSSSEYASPIVLVKKKDGTARLCVDYRKLNRKLVKDRFPLPLIEDVLDKLQDAKVYSTLDLKNEKDLILKEYEDFEFRGVKRMRHEKYVDINDAVLEWFKTVRAKKIPVSGPMIQHKAKELADALGIENFSSSNGWQDRFRIRNNITFQSLCGEAADVDPSLCEELLALFFRALPNKSMIQKSKEARGGKIPKEWLTIIFCVSAAVEKEKPLVIWRCQRPRCFKGKDLNRLGVSWYANKKAWMTSSIFEEWLVNFDKKMRNQARKVLLVLDNATYHAHGAQLKNVKLLYLPPNTKSKLLLNHGVIKCFKMEYRQCALRHVIARIWMDAKVLVNFQRKFLSEMLLTGLKPPEKK
ncbi:Tigger transposable element-derived protein 6 [Araneus ventricosus]|uniref:Tigger transposable element-derived protein 6 n=1 Tax=Araneus ventricosus TaxID=182803 RepID=A0A4Y2N456_ARAVE|nr:Tigger transposable element-derived protein 6 [Araneus ventricosus]